MKLMFNSNEVIELTDGQRRTLLHALGHERTIADDPGEIDRLAGLVIAGGLEGGWRMYQAGQVPPSSRPTRLQRCERMARTLEELGETPEQVADALLRNWSADVVDEVLVARHRAAA